MAGCSGGIVDDESGWVVVVVGVGVLFFLFLKNVM